MYAINNSLGLLDSVIAESEKSLKWGYSTRVRAVAKRGLILIMRVFEAATPPQIKKIITLINYTYLIDIPISIRGLLNDGKSLLSLEDRVSQFIGVVGLATGGLDFVDTLGTFLGSVLDPEKNSLLRVINTYGNGIFAGIMLTVITSRLLKIFRIYALNIDFSDLVINKKIQEENSKETVSIKNALGENVLKALREDGANQQEILEFWAKRKVIYLGVALLSDALTLSLFVAAPVSGAVLALTAKVIVLASKIFEDFAESHCS